MPKYEIKGQGKDTGRKRKRTYWASTENDARQLAEEDKTLVEEVIELPTEPATVDFLNHVVRKKIKKEDRSTDLLKDPFAETAEGWYMCVPLCFNDALDIKLTKRIIRDEENEKEEILVWTQGSSFAFNSGDTLYDTHDAYKVWSEALKTIGFCVRVKTSSNAGPTEGDTGRSSGSIIFSILTPNKDQSKIVERGEHSMSQDDFVGFLISGPSDEFKNKIERLQQN